MSYVKRVDLSDRDFLSRHRCSLPTFENMTVGTIFSCPNERCRASWVLDTTRGDYGKVLAWRSTDRGENWSSLQHIVSSALPGLDDYFGSEHACEVPSAKFLGIGTQVSCDNCGQIWELKNRLGDYGRQIDWRAVSPKWSFFSSKPRPIYIAKSEDPNDGIVGMYHHPVDGWALVGSTA